MEYPPFIDCSNTDGGVYGGSLQPILAQTHAAMCSELVFTHVFSDQSGVRCRGSCEEVESPGLCLTVRGGQGEEEKNPEANRT